MRPNPIYGPEDRRIVRRGIPAMQANAMTDYTLAGALWPQTEKGRFIRMAVLAIAGAALPVFTNTPPQVASPAYLLGPTGGYLIGWVGAAFLVGSLAERGFGRTLP